VKHEWSTYFFTNSTWDSSTQIFTWGNKAGREAWMSDDWTFLTVKGLSGDLSKYTKLYFKLEDFTNSVENKLTLYFKENKGNTQSMDYVSKVEITPDANGEFELDLTAFDWKTMQIHRRPLIKQKFMMLLSMAVQELMSPKLVRLR
jgi:hypothetical protein